MKKHFLFYLFLLTILPYSHAQILEALKGVAQNAAIKLATKAADKVIQDAQNGKNKKADKSSPTGSSGDMQNNWQVKKRTFDFVQGGKVLFAEDFSTTLEGSSPAGWKATGNSEVVALTGINGKWLQIDHKTQLTKTLANSLPENCTIEFDVFTSNLTVSQDGSARQSPHFYFTVGSSNNNLLALHFDFGYHTQNGCNFSITGVNDLNNSTKFDFLSYTNRAIPVRIAMNKERLRIWIDETKIADLQNVVSNTLLKSGMFSFYSEPTSASPASYQHISNIRIADASVDARDLTIGNLPNNNTPAPEQKVTQATAPTKTNTTITKQTTNTLATIGNYHALIIAVEDYRDKNVNKLDNPIKDGTTLLNTLTQHYTFEPTNAMVLKNPTKQQVFEAFKRLRAAVKENDNLLVFYAGHGYWDEDMQRGYWLPSDAEREIQTNWIANDDITAFIRSIKSKHTLLIADACFSGGIFKTREAFPPNKAIEEVYTLKSRKAMTSGMLTTVPDKSVFVQYLVKKLTENKEKYLTEELLFSQFKTAVLNNSSGHVPQFGTIMNTEDEGGNFIFIKK